MLWGLLPFENADLYIRFENDVRVFIYGTMPTIEGIPLRENEFVIFILTDCLFGKIKRNNSGYIYILD